MWHTSATFASCAPVLASSNSIFNPEGVRMSVNQPLTDVRFR